MVKSGRSDMLSVNRAPSGNQFQSHSINNTNNNNQSSSNDTWKVVNRKRRALVGTARPGGVVGTKVMGAPPPSRHFAIERVFMRQQKKIFFILYQL